MLPLPPYLLICSSRRGIGSGGRGVVEDWRLTAHGAIEENDEQKRVGLKLQKGYTNCNSAPNDLLAVIPLPPTTTSHLAINSPLIRRV